MSPLFPRWRVEVRTVRGGRSTYYARARRAGAPAVRITRAKAEHLVATGEAVREPGLLPVARARLVAALRAVEAGTPGSLAEAQAAREALAEVER